MEFTKILLSEAAEGMILAEDILDGKGHLVVSAGTSLSEDIIHKIGNYGVVVIRIVKTSDIVEAVIEDIDDDRENYNADGGTRAMDKNAGYYEKIRKTEGFKQFDETFQSSVQGLENEFNDIAFRNKQIEMDKLLGDVDSVIKANTTERTIFEVLDCIRGYDDQTFVHSMNVALICKEMAEWLGYGENQQKKLMAAGMLHDIGKVKIPLEILTKPGSLTSSEYQIIKYHTVFGFEILKNQPIDVHAKNTALMHHERYDGSGYPNGLKGTEIDEFARIVAIADVYDAMTAKRVYRDEMSPFSVIEYLEKEICHFDPEILLLFLRKMAQSYVSNTVLLSNGEKGKIAMINNNALGRPVVITDSGAIDLSRRSDVSIAGLL